VDRLRYSVEDFQGHASLIKAEGISENVKEGSELGLGDQIQLENDAQAVLMLNGEAFVQLGPGTHLAVAQLETQSPNGFISRLKLLGGRILVQVPKLGETRSAFEVDGGGVVCAVRGALFETELRGEELETRTYEGETLVSTDGIKESVKAGRAFSFHRGLLRMRRRLDRTETDRFLKWKSSKTVIREKHLKHVHPLNRHRNSETRPIQQRSKATSWVPS
jgi:hypothetical protein